MNGARTIFRKFFALSAIITVVALLWSGVPYVRDNYDNFLRWIQWAFITNGAETLLMVGVCGLAISLVVGFVFWSNSGGGDGW